MTVCYWESFDSLRELGDRNAPGVLVRRRREVLRSLCSCVIFPALADHLERSCEPLRTREQSERVHLRELHKSECQHEGRNGQAKQEEGKGKQTKNLQ